MDIPKIKKLAINFLPYFSFVFAIISIVLMNRNPERATLIVQFSLVGWFFVLISNFFIKNKNDEKKFHKVAKTTQYISNFATQALMAQALFFTIPFYYYASQNIQLIHIPFWILFVSALVVVSWDPLFAKILKISYLISFLQGFTVFVSLLTVLPMLGVSSNNSFILSSIGFSLCIPIMFYMHHLRSWKYMLGSVGLAILNAGILYFLAPFIPPTPLHLKKNVIALNIEKREPVNASTKFNNPESLYCFSQVKAPLGLKDKLWHVWKHDGDRQRTILLDIQGGSDHGFRTWSKIQVTGSGKYTCSVQTELGQIIGSVKVEVHLD